MSDEPSSLSPATKRDIETFLDRHRVEHDIPGLSVAILNCDGILHATGMGARNIESRSPATPGTLYSIASVTKSFTAVAVLQLVERGDLSLSDEIREYVDFWNDVPGEPITVRDLLSHSSGMPSDYSASREVLFADSLPTSPLVTREDDIRHANAAAARRITDEARLMNSNRGYQILGEIIEAASGRTYAEHVEDEIFAPLGMNRSRVGYGEISETADDAITGYVIEGGEPVANDHNLEEKLRPPYSAGGILSSVSELATLVRCLLNGGEIGEERLLQSDLIEAMSSHQAPQLERIGTQTVGYGYGLRVSDFLDETFVDHEGTAPGVSRAYVGYLCEHGIGVTLGINTTAVPISALGKGVLAITTGESPETVVPSLSLQAKIDAVTGVYEGFRGGLEVAVEPGSGGSIVLSYRDGPDWELTAFPESVAHDEYDFYTVRENGIRESVTFRDTGSGMELRFNIDRLERTSSRLPPQNE